MIRKPKPSKLKSITVHGFLGTGPTVVEAKADAVRKIEAQNQGYWSPRVYVWRGHVGFVYRTLEGWDYVIQEMASPAPLCNMPCTLSSETFQEACNACRRDLAQRGFDNQRDGAGVPFILKDNPEADQREQVSWQVWQLGYVEKMVQGGDDNACRHHASQRQYEHSALLAVHAHASRLTVCAPEPTTADYDVSYPSEVVEDRLSLKPGQCDLDELARRMSLENTEEKVSVRDIHSKPIQYSRVYFRGVVQPGESHLVRMTKGQ